LISFLDLSIVASSGCHDRPVTKIGGYPHWYYLVGVVVIFGCFGLGQAVADRLSAGGGVTTAIWVGSLVVGFVIARQVNAVLFRVRQE
jgi:hypothetical protein